MAVPVTEVVLASPHRWRRGQIEPQACRRARPPSVIGPQASSCAFATAGSA